MGYLIGHQGRYGKHFYDAEATVFYSITYWTVMFYLNYRLTLHLER